MKALVGVVVSVALAATFAACQNTVSGSALKVGDCFNYTNTTDVEGNSVESHAIVDCAEPHEEEVFSVFDYPNASGFPGYEQIGSVQQMQCESDFQTYVGVGWEESGYVISYDSPDEQTWAGGDHAIHCLLADGNGGKLTGSARGTKK
ncbi:MAG TPA: septum formation family protein [Candidatus Limnocylindrales bacterium]